MKLKTLAILLLIALVPGLAPAKPTVTRSLLSYDLGQNLAIGLIGRARNNPKGLELLKKAEAEATQLKVTLPAYPKVVGDATKDTVEAIHYLLSDAGKPARALSGRSSLAFEVGIKACLMRFLYAPGDDHGVAGVLKARCGKMGMPPDTVKALEAAVKKKAPAAEIGGLLDTFDQQVRTFLSTH